MTTDYLAQLDVNVVQERGVTRLIGRGHNVHFGSENVEKLRDDINRSVEVAYRYYRSKSLFPVLQKLDLCDLSLRVVVNHLYMYSNWRRTNEKYKDIELKIKESDLLHPQSKDEILYFCKSHFGSGYGKKASKIMGVSVQSILDYEDGRRRFADTR